MSERLPSSALGVGVVEVCDPGSVGRPLHVAHLEIVLHQLGRLLLGDVVDPDPGHPEILVDFLGVVLLLDPPLLLRASDRAAPRTRSSTRPGSTGSPCTPLFESVSFSASPPNGEISQICPRSSRAETNAIVLPSGDQRGWPSALGLLVSRSGEPPAAGTSQMSVLWADSLRSAAETT